MIYKEVEIEAIGQELNVWSLDDEGDPAEWVDSIGGVEVVEYLVGGVNGESFETVEDAKAAIDARRAEVQS